VGIAHRVETPPDDLPGRKRNVPVLDAVATTATTRRFDAAGQDLAMAGRNVNRADDPVRMLTAGSRFGARKFW
jgi:heme oxygenase